MDQKQVLYPMSKITWKHFNFEPSHTLKGRHSLNGFSFRGLVISPLRWNFTFKISQEVLKGYLIRYGNYSPKKRHTKTALLFCTEGQKTSNFVTTHALDALFLNIRIYVSVRYLIVLFVLVQCHAMLLLTRLYKMEPCRVLLRFKIQTRIMLKSRTL